VSIESPQLTNKLSCLVSGKHQQILSILVDAHGDEGKSNKMVGREGFEPSTTCVSGRYPKLSCIFCIQTRRPAHWL